MNLPSFPFWSICSQADSVYLPLVVRRLQQLSLCFWVIVWRVVSTNRTCQLKRSTSRKNHRIRWWRDCINRAKKHSIFISFRISLGLHLQIFFWCTTLSLVNCIWCYLNYEVLEGPCYRFQCFGILNVSYREQSCKDRLILFIQGFRGSLEWATILDSGYWPIR